MSLPIIIFIAILIIMAIGIQGGLRPWRRIAAYESRPTGQQALPKVSVVAYVLRDEDDLTSYVDTLLHQDYPDFEVILVCDASAETTAILSEKFENIDNLKLTFIPPGSHNLSRRKLAQTLGIKRATGEVILTTSTSVLPASDQWLRSIAEPFADRGINIVCGYMHPEFKDFTGPAKWYRQMDGVLTSVQWMAEAADGFPYRGDGFNLAFRRRLFFDSKGYAGSLTLMDGDDDVFINQISSPGAGALVLNPEAFVNTRWENEANRLYVELKDRYCFTRKYLPQGPFLRASLLAWANWLMVIAVVAVVCIGISLIQGLEAGWDSPEIPSLIVLGAGLLVALEFWLFQTLTYRKLAQRLGAIRLFWAVTPFILWRPIGNFLFFINHYPTRKHHYTWVRN